MRDVRELNLLSRGLPWIHKLSVLAKLFMIYAVIVSVYFGLLARDRFVCRAQFILTQGVTTPNPGTMALSLISANPSAQDAHAAISYILSMDMLKQLDSELDLHQHYSKAGLDLPHRLSSSASMEDMMDYYQDRVSAKYDTVKGIVSLHAEGFTPEFSRDLATAILRNAETHINERNKSIARRQVESLKDVLTESEAMVAVSRKDLVTFQNTHFTIDPQAEIKARQALILGTQEKIIGLEIEKTKLMADSPNSPTIVELNSRIQAMEKVIKAESRELIGDQPEQLNQLLAGFTKLARAVAFSEERYSQSLSVVESIRLETLRQNRFISVIESPFVPDEGARPRRLYSAVAFLIIGFMCLAIVRMICRTVEDHQNSYDPV